MKRNTPIHRKATFGKEPVISKSCKDGHCSECYTLRCTHDCHKAIPSTRK